MNVLLSLIVPTYNMELYLRRCLDSVTRKDISNILEVVVVNDGSKDASLAIAKEYEKARPDIVKIIDKQNGNYGSCVNAALPIVQGKYVKMLDADDWYDTDELIKLLGDLKNFECDMFITHYRRIFSSGKELRINISNKWEYKTCYNINDIFETEEYFRLQMHQIGYRTQLLRDINYFQTEGISYTDAEWTYMPLFHVSKVAFINADVYRYFIGREGQTMNMDVLVKSQSHEAKSLISMLKYKSTQVYDSTKTNLNNYLKYRTDNRALNIYFNSLIMMSNATFAEFNLLAFDKVLYENGIDEYNSVAKHYGLRSRLILYWRKKHKRCNCIIRKIIVFAYKMYLKLK